MGEGARAHSAARLGAGAHGLVAAHDGAKEFLEYRQRWPAYARVSIRKCVPFLAKERDILGVGVETVGTDAGQAHTFDPMFPCHTIMHGSNKFGLASLTNLDQLPPRARW